MHRINRITGAAGRMPVVPGKGAHKGRPYIPILVILFIPLRVA